MRPVRVITEKEENFRTEPLLGFEVIKRDFVEPEPVGTIIMMAFRITGYAKDCDGSAMVKAEHINQIGEESGWDIDSVGIYDDNAIVVTKEEWAELFAK